MSKIIISIPLNERQKNLVLSLKHSVRFLDEKDFDENNISDADIIIGNPNRELLKYAKNLKFLQLHSSGTNLYSGKNLLPSGMILKGAAGAYGQAVSEHMLAMLLSLMKNLHLYEKNQMKCIWKDEGQVTTIYNSTVLIVGLGDIGCEFGKKIKLLGGNTIGIYNKNNSKREFIDEMFHISELDTQIKRADVVALFLPSTDETFHIMNKERFSLMKPTAFLLNGGRGDAIEQEALLDALEQNKIKGAAIDVTSPEPLPENHRLWGAQNLLITPHSAGGNHLPLTTERIGDVCLENLVEFLEREES